MELEQLKTVWKKKTRYEAEGNFVSKEEVQRLIRKPSNTTISQIKRKIRNKVLIAGGIGLLLLAFALYLFIAEERVFDYFISYSDSASNWKMGTFYLVFGLVICFISVFNAFSYRKILNIESCKSDLKTSITNVLAIVQNAMKAKVYSDSIVVPGTVLTLVVLDLIRGLGLFPNITTLFLFVLGAVLFTTIFYFISKYSQNIRYASQIRALEECLEELDEER